MTGKQCWGNRWLQFLSLLVPTLAADIWLPQGGQGPQGTPSLAAAEGGEGEKGATLHAGGPRDRTVSRQRQQVLLHCLITPGLDCHEIKGDQKGPTGRNGTSRAGLRGVTAIIIRVPEPIMATQIT